MKISEMTLEELQDYAVQLENDKQGLSDQLASEQAKTSELQTLNTTLQKRNNELFLKVEQQPVIQDHDGTGKDEEPTLSCEDFANKNYKELIR